MKIKTILLCTFVRVLFDENFCFFDWYSATDKPIQQTSKHYTDQRTIINHTGTTFEWENCWRHQGYIKKIILLECWKKMCFNTVCNRFKSMINQLILSLSSVTKIPINGTSSEKRAGDSSVWVLIVVPLLTIVFISMLATSLYLFFRRRRCKIIFYTF